MLIDNISAQLFEESTTGIVDDFNSQFISTNASTYLEGVGRRFFQQFSFQDGITKLFDLLSNPLILAETTKLFQEVYYLEGFVEPNDPNSIEEREICAWLINKLESISIDDIFKDCLNAYITGIVGHELIWGGTKEKPELIRAKAISPALYTVQESGLRFLKNSSSRQLASGGRYKNLIFSYSTALNVSPIGDGVGKVLYYILKEREEINCSFKTFLQKGLTPTLIVSAEAGVQKAVVQNICKALGSKKDWKTIAVPKGITITALEGDRDYKIYEFQLAQNEKELYKLISGDAIVGNASSLSGSRGAGESANLRRGRAIGIAERVLAHLNQNLVEVLIDVKYGARTNYPKFKYSLPKLNQTAVATVTEAIQLQLQLGHVVSKSFYEKNYGLDIEEFGRETNIATPIVEIFPNEIVAVAAVSEEEQQTTEEIV